MTIAASISVNTILTRVAIECGLEAVSDPFGSPAQHYVQMKYLLQTAGEQLCLAFPWEFLVERYEINTEATKEFYPLPDDFQSFIDQSGWNNTTDQPLIGPLSSQEWNAIIGRSNEQLIRYAFRIFDGKFQIFPRPPADSINLTVEYQSRAFVRKEGVPDTPEYLIQAGSDLILFDRTLITRMLKVLWLEAKGFDTAAALQSFNQTFSSLTGKDKGGRVLDIGGSRRGIKFLDGWNVPISGFGI